MLVVIAVLATARLALADDTDDTDEPVAAVTSTKLERRELERRPHLRASDLLRHLAGLTTLVHGGQAPQFLVRGFAASQGELGVFIDGVPINIGSHAYVHGYADTQFLIADAIESIALYEGAYAPRYGSYSVAGTLDLKTIDRLPRGTAVVRITSGTELTTPMLSSRVKRLRYRLVGLFSPELEKGSALLGAEVGIDDGPYVHPMRFRRGVVLGKWQRPIGDDGVLSTAITFYTGRWFDSGLLSRAAIAADRLTPFSAADPNQGGSAQRASLALAYEVTDKRHATWHVGAYAVDSDLRLYTNPTLFVRDSLRGDEIEYVDRRLYYGIDAWYRRGHRIGSVRGRVRVGVQVRADHADGQTWHDAHRLRLVDCFGATNPCTDLSPETANSSVYVEEQARLPKYVRVYAGARLDQETWNVDDHDTDTMLGPSSLGGTGTRARIGPKGGIVVGNGEAELSLLAGAGSHSTDARASVDRSGFGAFIRTYNGEVGAQFRPAPELSAAFAGWWSKVAGNQVWDSATATPHRAATATRAGLDARFSFAPSPRFAADAALSVARGSWRPNFDGVWERLPGARSSRS